ncbi:unnamed protein product [Amoebophrya sp. A25]|nr:unnamed protein product [Amoebophrya sp. A25]|eukprot:GSA25T00012926001.1
MDEIDPDELFNLDPPQPDPMSDIIRVESKRDTSLNFELLATRSGNVLCVDVDFYLLGGALADVIDFRLHSRDAFLVDATDPDEPSGQAWRRKGKCNELVLSLFSKQVINDPNIRYYARSCTTNKILSQDFVEVVPESERMPDLMPVYELLLLFQARLKSARRGRLAFERDCGYTVEDLGLCYAGVLLEVFYTHGIDMMLTDRVSLSRKVKVAYVEELLYDQENKLSAQGSLQVSELPKRMGPTQFLAICLEYGHSSFLRIIADSLSVEYEKLLLETGMPMESGWKRCRRAEYATRVPVTGVQPIPPGQQVTTFQDKIAVLATEDGHHSTRTRARGNLLWGHLVTLLTLKVKSMDEEHSDPSNPIGLAMDGVTIGGRKFKNVRIRGDWFHSGLMTTLQIPPLIIEQYTSKDMADYIKSNVRLRRSEADKDRLKQSVEAAAVRKRLSWLFSTLSLLEERGVHLAIDKGSDERFFWCWCLANGYRIAIDFDQPHVESRTMVRLAEFLLPADFGRFTKIRSTADGVFSVRMGSFFRAFSSLPNSDMIDLLSDLQDVAMQVTGKHVDDPEFCECMRDRVATISGELSNFSGSKRWAKYAHAAEFVCENRDLLSLVVHALLEKSRPAVLRLPARVGIDVAKESGQTTRVTLNHSDLVNARMTLDQHKLAEYDDDISDNEDRDDEDREKLKDDERANSSDEDEIRAKADRIERAKRVVRDDEEADHQVVGDKMNNDATFLRERNKSKKKSAIASRRLHLEVLPREFDHDVVLPGDPIRPARPTEREVDKSLLAILWNVMNDPEDMLHILLYRRLCGPQLYYHSLGIMLSHNHLYARKFLYTQCADLLAENAALLNSQQSAELKLWVEKNGRDEYVCKRQGDFFLEVLRSTMRTAQVRMALQQRIWMYSYMGGDDLTLDEVKSQNQDRDLGKHFMYIYDNRKKWQEKSGFDESGLRTCDYNCDLLTTERDPMTNREVGGRIVLTSYTSWRPRRVQTPASFEKRLAHVMKDLQTWDTEQAEAVRRVMMNQHKYYCVKEFQSLLDDGGYVEAVDFATKWNSCRTLGTRDIEAGGGKQSRACRKANQSGSVVGTIPYYLYEATVPVWIPWLKPVNPFPRPGQKQRQVGFKENFSALDGRGRPEDFACDSKAELQTLCFGDGAFESNTIGLCSFADFQQWYKEYTDCPTKREGSAVQQCREYLSEMPSVGQKEITAEMGSVLKVNPTDHGLSDAQLEGMAGFKMDPQGLPDVFDAEMFLYECEDHISSDTVHSQKVWRRGRLQALYLLGILQKKRLRKEPLVLKCKQSYTPRANNNMLVYDVLVDICMVKCIELNPDDKGDPTDFKRNSAGGKDAEKDATKNPASEEHAAESKQAVPEKPEAGPNQPAKERLLPPDDFEEQEVDADSRRRLQAIDGSNADLNPLSKERYLNDLDAGKTVLFKLPEKRENWMFPIPTSMIAQKSYVKGLVLQPFSIAEGGGHCCQQMHIVDDAYWARDEQWRQRIAIPGKSRIMQPLAAAEEYGFFVDDNFAKGFKGGRKANIMQTVKLLAHDEPRRLELIRGTDWTTSGHDEDTGEVIINGPLGRLESANVCHRTQTIRSVENPRMVLAAIIDPGIVERNCSRRYLTSVHLFETDDVNYMSPPLSPASRANMSKKELELYDADRAERAKAQSVVAYDQNRHRAVAAAGAAKKKESEEEKEEDVASSGRGSEADEEEEDEDSLGAFFMEVSEEVKKPVVEKKEKIKVAALFKFVDGLSLTTREWSELYYIMAMGQTRAEQHLINRGVYPERKLTNKDGLEVLTHVSTLTATSQKVMAKLLSASMDADKAERQEESTTADKQKKKMATKKAMKVSKVQQVARSVDQVNAVLNGDAFGGADGGAADGDFLERRNSQGSYIGDEWDGADDMIAENEVCCEVADVPTDEAAQIARRNKWLTTKNAEYARECKLRLHRDEDLVDLHLNERANGTIVRCDDCKKQIGVYHRNWIFAKNGPTLRFYCSNTGVKPPGPMSSKATGPASHPRLKSPPGTYRCYCGWWRGGKCYKDETYTELIPLGHIWNCSLVQARNDMKRNDSDCRRSCNVIQNFVCIPRTKTWQARTLSMGCRRRRSPFLCFFCTKQYFFLGPANSGIVVHYFPMHIHGHEFSHFFCKDIVHHGFAGPCRHGYTRAHLGHT